MQDRSSLQFADPIEKLIIKAVTEEERPDRKPHYLRAANGRWSGHIIHPILASERCKSNMVKEAFALLAHIHDIIVHSNKSFAISMKII